MRSLCALALAAALAACYSVDHFDADPSAYDGLYFGSESAAPAIPAVKDDKWRNYAVFGLVPWVEAQTLFAGARLSQVAPDQRPMRIVVHTEQSLLNGLTSFGLGLVGGILAPLLFVPRTTEVQGWSEG